MVTPWKLLWMGVLAVSATQVTVSPTAGVRFDHLHLVSPSPDSTLGFYARLFRTSATRRVQADDAVGIGDDEARLLISRGELDPGADPSRAFWHFGWGLTSLGETYGAHLLKEVAWEPPFVTLSWNWHVHVLSRRPRETALWYRDVFDGDAIVAGETEFESWKSDEVGGIVRWRAISIILHRWDGRAPSDRPTGHRVDHLAFSVDDMPSALRAAVAGGAHVLQNESGAGRSRALVKGPDDVLIEVLGR